MIANPRQTGGRQHELMLWVVVAIVVALFLTDLAFWVEFNWLGI